MCLWVERVRCSSLYSSVCDNLTSLNRRPIEWMSGIRGRLMPTTRDGTEMIYLVLSLLILYYYWLRYRRLDSTKISVVSTKRVIEYNSTECMNVVYSITLFVETIKQYSGATNNTWKYFILFIYLFCSVVFLVVMATVIQSLNKPILSFYISVCISGSLLVRGKFLIDLSLIFTLSLLLLSLFGSHCEVSK